MVCATGRKKRSQPNIDRVCARCGKSFKTWQYKIRAGEGNYCSQKCVHTLPLIERFWDSVQKTDGCWIWTGSVTGSGYGHLSLGPRGKTKDILAHRLSWEIHKGPIPKGLFVLHECDNSLCVNPRHLTIGTQLKNLGDMVLRGRSARGECNGMAKFSQEAASQIRKEHAQGKIVAQIAREREVSHGTIGRIVRFESYK